jgi:hypothetical protein
MSRTLALNSSVQVKLNGSGNGVAQIGPAVPGLSWQITGVYVSVVTNVAEAVCTVYAAPAGPFTLTAQSALGTTATGSTGDTIGPSVTIWPGQVLVAQWTGGDPGQVATMSFWGTAAAP